MNTIKINITKDPNYGFSNLEFSEKPTTEMLQELKNNGWRYSSHFKRWYPATEEAKKNAESFAQDYYRHYTSEEQTKTIKTAESLVDLNSIENSVDAYISEYENEMKKGNYNAFVEVQEFIKKNSFITPKAKSYINRFIHSINDIKGVTAFVAYGKDFYTYDEGIKLISELNSKIEKYKSIKNNPAQNEYSDLLNMIKDELKMIDNSRNKGTLYSVLQKEGDSYEQKIRRSNERNNGDGRTDYSGESGNSLGNKVEEQRSVHNSDKISDPAGHSDSKMHDGLDSGRSTELEANGTSADIQRQRLQSNALEQEKLSETDKVNDSTRDAGNGTQNLSEGRVEVYSAERKGSIGAVGNGLNKYGEIQRKIYSYESFGYEGALVTVETDLRRGIPAIDIVGLADSAVKESRERVRAAFKNSGLEFPAERVLMSLSPADLKKDSAAHDLAIALSVLNEKYGYKGEPVLALGELELSGKLRPVRSVYAAVENAIKEGIRNIIVPKQNVEEVLAIPGVNVLGVSSLEEAHEKLINNEPFVTKETFVEPAKELGIKFNEELLSEAMNTNLEGYYDTARAIEIAIAGKHNILLEGAPGCGKTLLTQHLIPGLTPNLTNEEAQTTTRIWSIAGLLKPTEGLKKDVPFRMPHQTASIEGICGGGTKVNPGEISLAHNGVLFLDEAAEFRSSVLQMLRVPLETHSIALSRAGRTTVYPANFQLVMATNPCPCGNYGVEGKICLCSEKSREMYWKKFSDPLLDRIDIKQHVEKNEKDSREISAAEMKAHIENAFRIQRKNPHYNASLAPEEIAKLCSLNGECKKYFDEHTKEMSERSKAKMLKLALTIANMDNRTEIALDDLKEARELNSPLFEKPNEFRKEPVYEAVAKKSKQIAKETKPYSFFVKDTAEFEQFAEFEPITNLSAKEAVETMLAQEMIELSAGIGIHIPGDSVFNDPDGMGAIVFNKFNGQYSFYMGESFVKELKDNNEHAKNVIAAFKELDEAIKHSRIKPELYKKPDFIYEKEKEINGVKKLDAYNINGETYTKTNIEELLYEDINAIFHELDSGEMEQNLTLEAVKVYRNPEQDGKISLLVQYDSKNPENKWREDSLFDALKEENITFNGMEVDVNPITAEKSGTIEEYLQKLEGFVINNLLEDNSVKHENGYVLTKSGSKDFGEITPEIASEIHRESGKIRLETGSHDNDGRGYGEVHIERDERLKQLKQNGFENARDFIEYVTDDFDAIYEGINNTLVIVKRDEKANLAYLSLRQNEIDKEIFYTVESALISRQNYLKENKLLWTNPNSSYKKEQERAQSNHLNETPSAISGNSFDKLNIIHENNSVNEINEIKLKKDIKAIREQCREILKKPDNEITDEDKLILAQYEGAGGLNEENRTISGILNEFYTPNNLVEKVWQVVDTYAPEAKTVLEPSAGVGKFANNRPNNTFTMHELDETSARINKILHPEANVIQGAYQKQFFDAGERIHIPQQKAKYDVVIGNPPYGAYNDKYKGLGEGKEFDRYEEYFISKGLDALKDENSVMAYVVPSGFLNTASDKQKEILASKGKLIDAYRLPVGVFPTTEVGTDIIIMQSWEKERKDLQKHWDSQGRFLTIDEAIKAEQKGHVDLLSNGEWFRQHPEKILGEIKKRTNRFGKEEEYVAVHECLTIQDELNKIEDLLPDTNKTQITQQAETVSNEKEQEPVTLSIEELSLAKSVIPEQQFITTLSLSKGEEGDFFKQKIKDIANAVSKAPKLYETDGAEQHALLFRYFHPAGTESLVCEIGEDGEAFGFQCINGDYINAEWGYIDLNELKKNPEMQLDYHVPKGMSIERWLYKEQPDMYPDYAKFAEQSEKTPFDIAKETGNDVEAVANAMNEQTPSEKVHSETVGESVDDKSLREYDDPDGLFKTPKILSMQEFSKFYTGNNFDEKDYNIWANTDYRGIVNTASLSAEEKEYLKTSGKYVEPEPGIYTNAMLYATGKIYEKLDELEKQKENLSSESYEKCKSILEKAVPELYPMSKIQMDVLSPLAEEFTVTRTVTRKQRDYGAIKNVTSDENLNLKEDFLSWCTGYLQPDSENTRTYIQDFSVANVSREEIPENISFNDIAAYVDRIPVNTGISEDDTKEERNAKLTVAGAKKDARKETAYKLFNRYLQTGLSAEEKEQFCLFWNKIYNGTVQADYKKLPLFIDGMSTYKGREPFKLYKQQIEGINRLVSKGNGLLAYGVGVGKTAAGICASIAQMQSKRAKRPLIICPDQVYEKWVRDLRELFPNVTINELGNLSDPFLEANHYDEATHSLIIPENSVSVMIDSALQKITFTDEACNEYLAKDFGCVLGLSAELESGDDRDRANALQKIQNLVGKASRIKTVKVPGDNIARETEIQQSYVFFDRCNWDNICVDEAHKYKNLFVIPRAKKGDKKQANEFEGIGSAAQSRRALKMFGMTTIIQQQNENRNVFLLTATPFTNNPLEVYSMLSFMARKELLDRHIYDVRDFCTEFALTKNEYAVTPDGDIKPKNVMKAFKGQKKLRSLITEFIDSKSAEDAGIPKPEGERHAVFLELTDLQQAIINYNEAAIKNASGKDGVVLRAMTHMRTATLSPALLDSDDYPGLDIPPLEKVVECSPKLKYECDTVADVYKHKPECGQFIYMPQGVESFQYVKEYLIKQGVPEEAIEYVSGKHNNTNKKKQKVADRFNDKEDKLKVLIGSSNVAEGIDLNGNSICCYNTMLGWNPTESVQVEGRIWRQGNEQGKVHIYYPLMEDSIDALIYQKHDEKASRINSIFKENENDQDTIDVSEIDPETVKFELIKDPLKKVDMLIEQDTAEFKKELKILENRTETINDLVKAYGIIKNMIAEEKSEHEKYSELVKQYRENLKNIPENDSTRWQHEGRLEAAVHTRDVAYKELQKGNARMNSIMTNFMRMDIKVPETEAAIKLEEISRKKQAIQEKIESIEKSKDKRIEEEQIKLLQKKLVAKPLEQQRKETVEYILKNTWYKTTEEKVEPEKPVVKDASITTEPITSIPIELEERFNEALEKKDFKVLSQFCCWGDRNSIKEYSENNAAIKIFCDQFEKKYNIGLPSDIGDRFITLVNFCDPETLPEEYKFKDLEEAISYELKDLNSGTENSSKRIKEFYEKKPNVNEFANFLKEEYGTGGHSFIGYDHWHDAKGIKLTALINGKKESKLYSWNEIASRMSKIIEKSRPRVDFEIMSEEKRKSFDSFQQQDLFGFEELNPSKVLEYGEYDEIGFTSKFINANKGLLPVIKEKEDVYKVYCKGKDICNYESSKDIYIHDADDVEISVSKKLLQNVARQYIQNKVIENIKSEYEDGNFKKKKIAVPKLSEITETQKDVFIKNGIDDENEMLKMYRETYKDVLLSGEKPILVAKKQDSSVSVKDSRTVTKEATYIINDENIGY